MPLINPVAGRYSSTLDPPGATGATSLGITEDGYEFGVTYANEVIEQSDAHARQAIDDIFQGVSRMDVSFTCLEAWAAGPLLALNPYGAVVPPSGAGYFGPGTIARLGSNLAGILIFSATAGTPAAAAPASLTATLAKIAEGFPVRWTKSSRLRKLPLQMRIYPYDDGGIVKFWSVT